MVEIELTATPKQHEILDWRSEEAIVVNGYAYNGTLPAPTIRAKVGDTVIVHLTNQLEAPTTIHWHGIDVPNNMDGTPLVQPPVQPGDTFTYQFTVDRAGTAWYHPHFDTEHQVNHGLYGAFIVDDPSQPVPENELIVILDDWDFASEEDDGSAHHSHETYYEGVWTVNGLVEPTLELSGSDALSLRVINASNFGYAKLGLPTGTVHIGSDAGLLSKALETETLILTPGDRGHLLLPIGPSPVEVLKQPFSHHGGESIGDPKVLWSQSGSQSASPDLSGYTFDLASPSADPSHTDAYFAFQGDPRTMRWLINGEVFPDISPQRFELGRPAIWELRNISATHHPFHLHGMAFEVLSRNGIQPEQRQIEDTIDLALYERVRIKVPMNNPGQWMTHCHILPHGDNGMMTIISVE
ncbi:MAG: multicopper oxidase family protein [Myxococcota bacterium]|nr:multicopper oxidase family protein [Myxococcota bacterium]